MSFVSDLKVGKEYEDNVRNKLNITFGCSLESNVSKLGIDLVSEGLAVEVKYDRQCRTTGNIFLEYECSGKPSWVYKYSLENSLFIYWDEECAYVFNLPLLQELVKDWIENSTYRLTNGWDGWKVKGILVPISELPKYIEGVIYFNNNPL